MDATDRLILCCAKAGLDSAGGGELEQLLSQVPLGGIDWKRFVRDASRHGLLPLANHILKDSPEESHLPPDVKECLHGAYMQGAARTILLNHELRAVLARFSEANIQLMVLKGPYLSEKIYSQRNIRFFCDLDLLVSEKDVAEAGSLLNELDYRFCPERARFWWEDAYPEKVFAKTSGSLCEIHWNILDKKRFLPANIDINNEIWENATQVQLFGLPVRQMAPEHLLIYLSLHLAVIHRFGILILYRDLAEVLNFYSNSFNWDYFVKCVAGWQVRSQVYYPLYFAAKLLDADIPDNMLREIRPRYLTARFFELIFRKTNFVSLPKYTPVDALFLALRDQKARRYKCALGLPYRVIRWHLKGNTC